MAIIHYYTYLPKIFIVIHTYLFPAGVWFRFSKKGNYKGFKGFQFPMSSYLLIFIQLLLKGMQDIPIFHFTTTSYLFSRVIIMIKYRKGNVHLGTLSI
jgi:hypothetical protein